MPRRNLRVHSPSPQGVNGNTLPPPKATTITTPTAEDAPSPIANNKAAKARVREERQLKTRLSTAITNESVTAVMEALDEGANITAEVIASVKPNGLKTVLCGSDDAVVEVLLDYGWDPSAHSHRLNPFSLLLQVIRDAVDANDKAGQDRATRVLALLEGEIPNTDAPLNDDDVFLYSLREHDVARALKYLKVLSASAEENRSAAQALSTRAVMWFVDRVADRVLHSASHAARYFKGPMQELLDLSTQSLAGASEDLVASSALDAALIYAMLTAKTVGDLPRIQRYLDMGASPTKWRGGGFKGSRKTRLPPPLHILLVVMGSRSCPYVDDGVRAEIAELLINAAAAKEQDEEGAVQDDDGDEHPMITTLRRPAVFLAGLSAWDAASGWMPRPDDVKTPLMQAVIRGDLPLVRVLLNEDNVPRELYGHSLRMVDQRGKTAFDLAFNRQQDCESMPEIIALLARRGSPIPESIATSAAEKVLFFGSSPATQIMLTRLQESTRWMLREVVKHAGTAMPSLAFEWLCPSSSRAVKCFDYETAMQLLRASPSLCTMASPESGQTLLHYFAGATRSCGRRPLTQGDVDLCEYLLNNGADPNRRSLDGRTPLDVLVYGGRSLSELESALKKLFVEKGGQLSNELDF